MVVHVNTSTSALSEILRPAYLVPTNLPHSKSLKSPFLHILSRFEQQVVLTMSAMPKINERWSCEWCRWHQWYLSVLFLPKARRLPRQGQEKWENGSKTKKLPIEVAEPKTTERRSACFERLSEIPHADLTVTPCNDLVACQLSKFRSFSSLVSSFLLQTQNVLLKPVFQKKSRLSKNNKKQERGIQKANP